MNDAVLWDLPAADSLYTRDVNCFTRTAYQLAPKRILINDRKAGQQHMLAEFVKEGLKKNTTLDFCTNMHTLCKNIWQLYYTFVFLFKQ